MLMQAAFLLINVKQEYFWRQVLEDALTLLGTLQTGGEEEAVTLILQRSYDVIIVDTAAVKDVPLLISRIRDQQPEARIVVVTASPTWRRARAAFLAGAADYIHKSLNKEELLSMFSSILARTPPPWPR
jgi:DNA-binding NarL/FixJ family response regulator